MLFHQNKDIFNEVLQNRKDDKWLNKFEESLKEIITPALALAIKIKLKMSNRKYTILWSMLRRRYNHETKKYEIRKVKGKKLPSLFPSLEKVTNFQESLRSLNPESTPSGYRQNMRDLIVKILQIPELRALMHIENETLKLKVGCDGFKLTRYQCKLVFLCFSTSYSSKQFLYDIAQLGRSCSHS